jgi:hypothetical protein
MLFAVLSYNMAVTAPPSAIAQGAPLATSFLGEVVYRRATGRKFKKVLRQTGHLPGAATRDRESASCLTGFQTAARKTAPRVPVVADAAMDVTRPSEPQ